MKELKFLRNVQKKSLTGNLLFQRRNSNYVVAIFHTAELNKWISSPHLSFSSSLSLLRFLIKLRKILHDDALFSFVFNLFGSHSIYCGWRSSAALTISSVWWENWEEIILLSVAVGTLNHSNALKIIPAVCLNWLNYWACKLSASVNYFFWLHDNEKENFAGVKMKKKFALGEDILVSQLWVGNPVKIIPSHKYLFVESFNEISNGRFVWFERI